jgi:ABC-type branched-subunit amino acid transport system substrate-binding protein
MTQLRLGACLSLTGRYGRFGRQAAHGLMAWQRLMGAEVEFEIEDDGSDPELFADRFDRVAAHSDLLLGPYSTQLMHEAGRAMADTDALLWNQGGSGDDVQALCSGRIVSVLAPTSRYALPFVRTRAEENEQVALWVVRGRGRFGRQVAGGAVERAERDGLEVVEHRVGDAWSFEDAPAEWDLFSCGTFEDDVAIVREARAAANPPRAICSIAAGVQEFASQVDDIEGVFGIAQWFPGDGERPELGPADAEFVSAYREIAGAEPDYPAVQAAAAATIATHCAELAGSLDRGALWVAASELETTTLLGAFGIDPMSGAQVKQETVLLQWRDGVLQRA